MAKPEPQIVSGRRWNNRSKGSCPPLAKLRELEGSHAISSSSWNERDLISDWEIGVPTSRRKYLSAALFVILPENLAP